MDRLLRKVSKVFDEEDENLDKLEKEATTPELSKVEARRYELIYLRGLVLDTIVMDEAE